MCSNSRRGGIDSLVRSAVPGALTRPTSRSSVSSATCIERSTSGDAPSTSSCVKTAASLPLRPSSGRRSLLTRIARRLGDKLTKIPIIVFYGDNIPEKPTANLGQDSWRIRLEMARLWREAVNRRGGDVTVVHLPQVGIRGQHALSILRSEQWRDCRPAVGLLEDEASGLVYRIIEGDDLRT